MAAVRVGWVWLQCVRAGYGCGARGLGMAAVREGWVWLRCVRAG